MTTWEFWRTAWKGDLFAVVVLGLILAGCIWSRRWGEKRGAGRSTPGQWLSLLLGFAVLLLALVSPLRVLAGQYLFSAHMLQHLLLLLVVPPLILMGLPPLPAADGKAAPFTLSKAAAWLAGVGAMWVWHAPALCNAAATDAGWFRVQVLSLLVCGALFWRPIVGPVVEQRLPPLTGIGYLFSACLACTLLGIYISFVPVSLCAAYAAPVDRLGILTLVRERWGLSPAVDQSLGGLLMWVPGCLIYLCAILGLLARWYGDTPAPASDRPGPGANPQPKHA